MLSLPDFSLADTSVASCPEGYASSATSSSSSSSSSGSGSSSSSGSPTPPQCLVYGFIVDARGDSVADSTQHTAAAVDGQDALTGPATDVSCIADAITWCSQDHSLDSTPYVGIYDGKVHSPWDSNWDMSKFGGDDCIGYYLEWGGQLPSHFADVGALGSGWVVNDGTYFYDKSCNFVSGPSGGPQCDIKYTFFWSPISLIWEDGATIDDNLAIVQFPLEIGSSKQWYTWKASDRTPLLVYDPGHEGKVTSPTQLFGNWTFGGQRTAFAAQLAKGEQVLPRPWKDGYEALATLDANDNGELEGEELTPLALWFDSNQDGKSQAGEVKPALDLGISRIFVTPNRRDPVSKEIFADRGFERRTSDGKSFIGKSVDWFGESFSNQLEGVAMMQARNDLLAPLPASAVQSQQHFAEADSTVARLNSSLKGIWRWQSDSGDLGSYQPSGVLSLQDDGRNISGHAYVEVPLKKAAGRAARFIRRNTIQGERTLSAAGTSYFV